MGHGITATDAVAVTKASIRGAFDTADGWDWHGLAVRMPGDSMTIDEARRASRLDWQLLKVDGVSCVAEFPGEQQPTHVLKSDSSMLIRSDTREPFAVVSSGYSPTQPVELFDVAAAIIDAGAWLRVESIGSVDGGRTLFASVRGEDFEICRGDQNRHYLTIILGMAGNAAWHHFPMAWRTLCKNGVRATIAEGRRNASAVTIRHTGDMNQKVAQARRIIENWKQTATEYETIGRRLAGKAIDKAAADAYFARVIEDLELGEAVPDQRQAMTDKGAKRKREKAVDMLQSMRRTMDREAQTLGVQPSAWLAANAATHWYDHVRTYRGANDRARRESKVLGGTIGQQADAKAAAFRMALELVPA